MVETKAEVLAIIPARGGSKGIPGKNIRNFSGFPLLAYSIAAGLQSKLVSRVIVSTDDVEIAAVAREYGAETPFMRPSEFAADHSLDFPVFEHALEWLEKNEGYIPDIVVQLRPTSPVRPRKLVDEAVALLIDHPEADSVRGIVPSGENPHKMWRINAVTGEMQQLLSVEGIAEPYNAPRQILPSVYWQTGHIDAIRGMTIRKKKSMSGDIIFPIIIDKDFTVDIDNLSDWDRAEWLVNTKALDMVVPQGRVRKFPQNVELLVLDFDGVLTDNRVWVNQEGVETVAANRGDGMGIRLLKEAGKQVMVISTEENPVVAARCRKMKIPVMQGIYDKATVLNAYLTEHAINPDGVVFMGNDVNDTPCFPLVSFAVVPADAEPEAKRKADLILQRNGGYGVVRELCDLIIKNENIKK
ncbi:MAG: acylneuraminate cytidylyltransferase [Anaerolineaceae bacterium]|nr:acylneuraminate cytidylyltransferase [Anaerolineaceae bacterium]